MQKVETGEIVVYQPDEIKRLEVKVEGETLHSNCRKFCDSSKRG